MHTAKNRHGGPSHIYFQEIELHTTRRVNNASLRVAASTTRGANNASPQVAASGVAWVEIVDANIEVDSGVAEQVKPDLLASNAEFRELKLERSVVERDSSLSVKLITS